jgi:hypothetical protein
VTILDLSLALEHNPVENDLADALALGEAVIVVERVVDAGIEPRDGGFRRGPSKEGKVRGAWGGTRLWSVKRVSVNGISPNRSVRTIAAAPDCVEWPEVYEGKLGVTRRGTQVELITAWM